MSIKHTYGDASEIPQGLEGAYTQTADGSFALQVDGMVDKGRLDEFRDNNVGLRKEIESHESMSLDYETRLATMQEQMRTVEDKYAGIDMEEWSYMQQEQKAMEERDMIERGDVDSLINSRVDEVVAAKQKELTSQKESYEHQIFSLQEDLVNYDGQLSKMLVDNELTKIASSAGIAPSAMDDVLTRGREVFRVENGKAVAFSREGRQMYQDDAVTPVTIDGWVDGLAKNAPHLFESSSGAGMTQPSTSTAKVVEGVSGQDAILAGLAALNKDK